MTETTPEEVGRVYRERFRQSELDLVVPDGSAGTVRRDMRPAVGDFVIQQLCELCPSRSDDGCWLDCAEVRRIAYAEDKCIVVTDA
jgi:hypothetical protein